MNAGSETCKRSCPVMVENMLTAAAEEGIAAFLETAVRPISAMG